MARRYGAACAARARADVGDIAETVRADARV
jgi:hypothetical protein